MSTKKQWKLLFITFLFSSLSLTILIVSISTTQWIQARARNSIARGDSEINYGLFRGSLTRYFLSSGQKFDLTLTCNYGEGVCIYSCQKTYDARQDELDRILKGQTLIQCTISDTFQIYSANDTAQPLQSDKPKHIDYIKSGYWASTVSFLIIAIIFSFTSAIFSIINIYFNPVESIFSIFGLYIWNGISGFLTFLVLILWGALYDKFLKFNISITDTLNPQSDLSFTSDGLASIGYSYFILILPFILHIGNIGIIYRRQYILDKEIPPPTVTVSKSDPAAIFY